ncbi:MAG: MgtC/SapB family protein, partial [Treponema sp.]|nr:MgtC/SapB family protein [Treponema sp.]
MIKDPIAQLLGEWSSGLGLSSILLRIGLSVFLSALIGWERSSKRHSAGFRTFILVTLSGTV